MTNPNSKVYHDICRENFSFFIREAFTIINPGTKFLSNWHIDLICCYLREVHAGNVKRLIINIPPRSLKSTIVSVCWPAWIIGNNPSKRIICASYSQHLSDKLAIESRYLLQSSFFKDIFPKVKIVSDQNKKNKFIVSERGFRFATSVGGTTTGEGGDVLILDDPHNALDINSPKKRQKTIDWFRQSFLSRLDDKKNGAVVIVMQRLHQKDLTGFLLENNLQEWEVLKIPILADKDINYKFENLRYNFKKNQLLYQEHDNIDEIEKLRNAVGSYAFNAQYMQNPLALGSGMLKSNWLEYYQNMPKNSDHITQSWDTAIKSGDGNSYTVCTTWCHSEGKFYLLDVYRDRIEYPELKRKIVELYQRWQAKKILIEDKASGQAILQDLRQNHWTIPLIPVQVHKDKFTRFASITTLFECGRVLIPENIFWKNEYEQELLSFPNSTNDDQVDSSSQYLNYMMSNLLKTPRIRNL
jgi:predicted phage terminase large subunit-like protein